MLTPNDSAYFRSLAALAIAATTISFDAHAQSSNEPHALVDVLGGGSTGTAAEPRLAIVGSALIGNPFELVVQKALPNSVAIVGASLQSSSTPLPQFGATVHLEAPYFVLATLPVGADGTTPAALATDAVPPFVAGVTFFAQALVVDPLALGGFAFSPALEIRFGVRPSPRLYDAQAVCNISTTVIADVDSDGELDLVGMWGSSGPFSIAYGTGNGTFQSSIHYGSSVPGSGSAPFDAFDVDGDGHVDILRFSGTSGRILFGEGNRNFSAQSSTDVEVFAGMRTGDVNGDGLMDFVSPPKTFGFPTIKVLLAESARQWAAPFAYGAPDSLGVACVLDVTGDGIDDIVVPQSIGQLAVFIGDRDGMLDQYLFIPSSFGTSACEAGDFDGDGFDDLLLIDEVLGMVQVRRALPGVGLLSPVTLNVGPFEDDFSVYDVDRDGRSELVMRSTTPPAGFQSFSAFEYEQSTWGVRPIANFEGTSAFEDEPLLADFDDDGNVDAAVGLSTLYGSQGWILSCTSFRFGDGTVDLPLNPTVSQGGGMYQLETGDVNGDGHLDLVGLTSSNSIVAQLGDGAGSFTPVASALTQQFNSSRSLSVGDLDGDGFDDVVLTGVDQTVTPFKWRLRLLRGDQGGNLVEDTVSIDPQNVRFTTIADVDGDGRRDLVYGRPTVGLVVHYTLADGTLGPATVTPSTELVSNKTRPIVADFDGDGLNDVLCSSTSGTSEGALAQGLLLLGTGGTSFASPLIVDCIGGLASTAVADDQDLEAADLNGDGYADIVVAFPSVPGVTVTLGLGGGTFAPRQVYALGVPVEKVFVVDVDGDTRLDIVASNGIIHVLLGNGDGTFGEPKSYSPPRGEIDVALFDCDGDSAIDMLLDGGTNSSLRALFSRLHD